MSPLMLPGVLTVTEAPVKPEARSTSPAIVGRCDSIIVQIDDANMVAHKTQAQKIKDLVKKLAEDKNFTKLV